MRERRARVFRSRPAMHKGRWPKRGLARKAHVRKPRAALADRYSVRGRQFHKEVVRVLFIDEGAPLVGLAGLEEQPRAALRKSERLKAEHAAQLQGSVPDARKGHRHNPV